MASIRVRFENGIFVPLDAVDAIQEGDEFVLLKPYRYTPEEDARISAKADATRGVWADLDIDLSDIVNETGPTARDT